ncbi:ISNCY family transposase [Herbivorax alkaliphila]
MNENKKYEIIKKLVETKGNKKSAACKIGCTIRTINRMIKGYINDGKAFFVHGNKGRKPAHTLPEDTKKLVNDFYSTKYSDANFTHFKELLEERENINISNSSVRNILMKNYILSPKAHKSTKKRFKKLLKDMQKQPGLNKTETKKINSSLVEIENSHPRRPRAAYYGELVQMDASVHLWFGDSKTNLHIAVDDCTGKILGASFDKQETLNGYYNILNQILINHGIPYKFLTDKRTVFEYNNKKNASLEDDTFTQFGYACKQLGIEIQCTSVAQAKGRVERIFETLQSRLPLEMRLAGVKDIKSANEFLNSYIKKFNARFALQVDNSKSVFEKQPSVEEINLILSVISKRKIDNGHCIKYNNKFFIPVNNQNSPVYYRKKTEALVIKSFDGSLYVNINDTIYGLNEIAKRHTLSKNFDNLKEKPKQKAKYIPPITHPWKRDSFLKYLSKQSHLKNKSA